MLVTLSFLWLLISIFKFDNSIKSLIWSAIGFAILILAMLVGYHCRNKIINDMGMKAKELGLTTIGLLKYKEAPDEVQYEVHVLVPKEPIATDQDITGRIAKAKRKLVLGFIGDIPKLYSFAKEQDKDVIFFGTSHAVFRKAWIKKWQEYGIESKEGPCMDPWAAFSNTNWRRMIKKFYGKNVSLPLPENEWKTLYTKISKGG